MVIFVDKKGRTIEIEADDFAAYAKHKGEEIGDIQTTGPRDEDPRQPAFPPKITGMDVNPEYQRSGIATEMIRLIWLENGEQALEPADKNIGVGGLNALTDDGEALTAHCQKLGYILPFASERFPEDDDDGGYD
ncbi:hypothetical protein [Brucella intermedia]|uniref:hypothetical protein n=1 Tax=Brucella intermedia TaxID=94625 RepID=UPI00124D8452|nr:hypothetical protein [Brucella intermedia]KAB2716963.1 hypothetical protein F9K75_12900 [Brucella intermedia]